MPTDCPSLRGNLSLHESPLILRDGLTIGQEGRWQWDIETDTTIWSEQLYHIAGYDPALALPVFREHSVFYTSESWVRLIDAVLKVFKTGAPYELKLQMIRPDGTVRWIIGRGEAVRDSGNHVLRLQGTAVDVTEQSLQQAGESDRMLQTATNADHWLSLRLINAHEEEKARLSSALRDDICQSLALLAVQIQQLIPEFPEFSAQAKPRIEELWHHTSEAIGKIARVSEQLRPLVIDVIGLDAAIRCLCRHFSKQYNIHVQCSRNIPADLDKKLALAFFRICQEALSNAANRSGVKNVQIELISNQKELLLLISDDGVGLESQEAQHNGGLGYLAMRERLHLIGGDLVVWSQPSFGTRLEARARLTEPVQESSAA